MCREHARSTLTTRPDGPAEFGRAVFAMSMLLVQEIGRWRCETPRTEADARRLTRLVTDEVERRPVLDATLLAALDVLADRHRGRDERLDAFLDGVLSTSPGPSGRPADHPRAA